MIDIRLARSMTASNRFHRRRLALCGLVVAMLLSACEMTAATPEAPPIFVDNFESLVSVTGKVIPAVWTTVGAQTGGMVTEILVEEGTQVAAGDVLVRFDDADAQLALRQAEAALAAAEAQVARTKVGARPEEIAVAEAQVLAAQTVISETLAQRDQLWSGAGDAEIAAAEAAVAAAQAQQLAARQQHDETMKCYNETCPLLGPTEEQARQVLHAADEALIAAEAQLEAAKSGIWAQRRVADASVTTVTAQYDIAVAQLELLKGAPLPQDIAIAEAAVAQAKVTIEMARISMARTIITAPFAGTVTSLAIRRGEFVAPGQPIITLGDLSTLRIETTDLDEIDVARISEGQVATLTFDAVPDLTLTGQIMRIAPMAEPSAGGVNYAVVINPGELPPQVRWGMTVFVDIDVNQ
ncbi:MAG: efflux RND transporter periplasmic adaptor subunit [Anaerolineae bacterium]|nr:efflux RND transporter periplasmic adaptor subunit [Anaerolineae bacterium]